MFKKSKLILIFLTFITLNFCIISKNTITGIQARKYIENIVDNLFIKNNHNGLYLKDLNQFISNLTSKLLSQYGHYPAVYSFSKEYKAEELYQPIVNASVDFIESKATEYAKEDIKKLIKNQVNSKLDLAKLISKVVKKIKEEISKKINNATYLDTGIFTDYYGASLYSKIHELLVKEIKAESNILQSNSSQSNYSQSNSGTTNLFSTEDCPICLERFGSKVDNQIIQRVFLKCGHNLCVNCLRQLYNTNKTYSCPLCRASINMSQYYDVLFAPSAPY